MQYNALEYNILQNGLLITNENLLSKEKLYFFLHKLEFHQAQVLAESESRFDPYNEYLVSQIEYTGKRVSVFLNLSAS